MLLTIIIFVLALLVAISTRSLAVVSSLGVTLSLLLFITGDYKNGGIFLLLAWFISPLGLPMLDPNQNAPFNKVKLIRSGITTYILAYSEHAKLCELHSIEVYSENSVHIQHGAALDTCALALEEFPTRFLLKSDGNIYTLKLAASQD